jgi:hypothetical protein
MVLNHINVLPYCDQFDSDADATLHGGPTRRLTYLDGLPEHQTSHQIQQHSLQQHTSMLSPAEGSGKQQLSDKIRTLYKSKLYHQQV